MLAAATLVPPLGIWPATWSSRPGALQCSALPMDCEEWDPEVNSHDCDSEEYELLEQGKKPAKRRRAGGQFRAKGSWSAEEDDRLIRCVPGRPAPAAGRRGGARWRARELA